MPDLSLEKKSLRSEMRVRVGALSVPDRAAASASIREHLRAYLLSWLAGQRDSASPLVASFAGLPDEPDLLPLVEEDTLPLRWCFPRVVGPDLEFHPIAKAGDFETGSFGIREPRPENPVTISEIDLFLVPGMAFDANTGLRLGRGKGFYDRTLARARPRPLFVGIGFSVQLVNGIPTEPHDIPLTAVLTESGLDAV